MGCLRRPAREFQDSGIGCEVTIRDAQGMVCRCLLTGSISGWRVGGGLENGKQEITVGVNRRFVAKSDVERGGGAYCRDTGGLVGRVEP